MSGIQLHAFHVSICEIEYDEKKKQLEITHRIFLDDLEIGLSEWSGEQIDILNPADPKKLNEVIGKYLADRTSYTLNKKVVEANYLGSEKEDGVMYCYQVITEVKKLKSLKVSNTVLFDIFDDQSNVVHIGKSEKTKSLKLSEAKPVGDVVFD